MKRRALQRRGVAASPRSEAGACGGVRVRQVQRCLPAANVHILNMPASLHEWDAVTGRRPYRPIRPSPAGIA